MTRTFFAPLIGLLLFGAALLPAEANASHNEFHGLWASQDVVDGSFQLMTIGGGSTPGMVLLDFDATVACPGGGLAIVSGRGEVDGSTMTVDPARIRCAGSGPAGSVVFALTDQGDGTLMDSAGSTWYRVF